MESNRRAATFAVVGLDFALQQAYRIDQLERESAYFADELQKPIKLTEAAEREVAEAIEHYGTAIHKMAMRAAADLVFKIAPIEGESTKWTPTDMAEAVRQLGGSMKCEKCGHESPRPEVAAIEGKWAKNDPRHAFVDGAKWWEYQTEQTTMWPDDVDKAEAEAEKRYAPSPQPLIHPAKKPDAD